MSHALFALLLPACTAAGSTAPEAPAASEPTASARWSFDDAPTGAPPPGFEIAQTGNGAPGRWEILEEPERPGNRLLAQVDTGGEDDRFPLAVATGSTFRDLRLSVRCRMVSGTVDQACGLVFRYRDAENYYVTRANALEGNVRFYKVEGGKRRQLASWSGEVAPGRWHDYRVTVQGDHVQVFFDGAVVLDARDATFPDAGRVGLWTKADSVTWFDDLTVEAP
jgi:hypothetical protein